MYLESPSSELRQGDVIGDVTYAIITEPHAPVRGKITSTKTDLREEHIVLLSHDCDLSDENRGKRTRLTFTPLKRLEKPKMIPHFPANPMDINALPAPGSGGQVRFVSNFFLAGHPNLPSSPDGFLLDFGLVYSSKLRHDELLQWKAAELDDETRSLLKGKLALHFGR